MLLPDSSWDGPLPLTEVREQLKTALFGLCAQRASSEALRTESIRVAVWALSVQKQGPLLSDTVVSTRQVLAHARGLWMPFRSGNGERLQSNSTRYYEDVPGETDLERDILDALEDQGDLFSYPGGYWLSAPLRLVPVTDTQYLLVGGVPTHLLPQTILQRMRLHGSFRQVDGTSIKTLPTSEFISEWQFQSRENWLGPSPPTLEQLIQKFRTQEMQQVSRRAPNQSYEAYMASQDKPQFQRWLPLDHARDGRYLVRTQTLWGLRQYSVGDIQSRNMVRQSTELRFVDTRRLCYALDHAANMPTTVIWERVQGRLVLKSDLPARERKLLASIGHLHVPKEGYYPREWVGIAPQHAERIDEILAQLCIRVNTGYGR